MKRETLARRAVYVVTLAVTAAMATACSVFDQWYTQAEALKQRGKLQATFIGQDGARQAGRLCQHGALPDNVHIHLEGLKTSAEPLAYRIEDRAAGGVWATPCNSISNWLIVADRQTADSVELYFKPFRDAPDQTQYTIVVDYADETRETITTTGSQVKTLLTSQANRLQAIYLGQDGKDYAGQLCEQGTKPDNIHLRLTGVRTDVKPIGYRIDDPAGGGVWALPCNPISNWLISADSSVPGQIDLYFKPFRSAPAGTRYQVAIQYSDENTESVTIVGSSAEP